MSFRKVIRDQLVPGMQVAKLMPKKKPDTAYIYTVAHPPSEISNNVLTVTMRSFDYKNLYLVDENFKTLCTLKRIKMKVQENVTHIEPDPTQGGCQDSPWST